MKPKWIFERGVHDHGVPERMHNIAREMGLESIEVVFSEESEHFKGILDVKRQKKLPFENNDCVVMYGSFSMARYLLRNHGWTPGVWFDVDALSCREYYTRLGEHLIHEKYAMMPLAEVRRQKDWLYDYFGALGGIFIRPDSQLKQFAGQVVRYDQFDKFYSEALVYGADESLCVVARPQTIRHEWRFVVADGKVITGSQYIRSGEVVITPDYPPEAAVFAEKVAASTDRHFHPIYCIDVCEIDPKPIPKYERDVASIAYVVARGDPPYDLTEGEPDPIYRLLEIGSVNTCGLYDCDLRKIVEAATMIAEREWNDVNS